jgi:CheY-like chemotaxis protein
MIARNQIHADLVLADSVAQALDVIDERLPDLVLTSPLLPSKDGAALSEKLRVLDAQGRHVQTFMIPALATPGQRPRPQQAKNAPAGRSRARNLSPPPSTGCDPVVFGLQVLALLDRAGADRAARSAAAATQVTRVSKTGAAASVPAARPTTPIEPEPPESAGEMAFEEIDVELEAAEAPIAESIQEESADSDWSSLLSAMRQDIEAALRMEQSAGATVDDSAMARVDEELLTLDLSAPSDVAEGTPDERKDMSTITAVREPSAEPSEHDRDAAPPAVQAESDARPAQTESEAAAAGKPAPPKKRKRRKLPRQDEWGFFDPQQCGLSVLIAKVNEITGNNSGTPPKK